MTGGGYLTLDGTDDYVSLGNMDDWLSVGDDTWAVEFWLRTSSTAIGSVAGVFNDGGTTGLDLRVNSDDNETNDPGEIECFARETAGNFLRGDTSGQTINDGNWHHIAVVFKGGRDDYDFIVDRNTVTSANGLVGASPVGTFASLAYDLTVGARNVRGTVGRFLAADIAELAFYTGTNSLEDFQRHYDAA